MGSMISEKRDHEELVRSVIHNVMMSLMPDKEGEEQRHECNWAEAKVLAN